MKSETFTYKNVELKKKIDLAGKQLQKRIVNQLNL
jgi:hypothetical protein